MRQPGTPARWQRIHRLHPGPHGAPSAVGRTKRSGTGSPAPTRRAGKTAAPPRSALLVSSGIVQLRVTCCDPKETLSARVSTRFGAIVGRLNERMKQQQSMDSTDGSIPVEIPSKVMRSRTLLAALVAVSFFHAQCVGLSTQHAQYSVSSCHGGGSSEESDRRVLPDR